MLRTVFKAYRVSVSGDGTRSKTSSEKPLPFDLRAGKSKRRGLTRIESFRIQEIGKHPGCHGPDAREIDFKGKLRRKIDQRGLGFGLF